MSSQTGTVSSTTGSSGWTNPNNIFTSNNVYAVSGSVSGSTGFINALGNGFSIPSGATIDGIQLTIEAKNQLSGNGFQLRPTTTDVSMWYAGASFNNAASSGISSQTWVSATESSKTFGSSTSLWAPNSTLTPSIVNDSSFGFRMRFFNTNGSAQTFSVDLISITVYYTAAGISSSSQQLFMYEG